jgi:hypothetical protein
MHAKGFQLTFFLVLQKMESGSLQTCRRGHFQRRFQDWLDEKAATGSCELRRRENRTPRRGRGSRPRRPAENLRRPARRGISALGRRAARLRAGARRERLAGAQLLCRYLHESTTALAAALAAIPSPPSHWVVTFPLGVGEAIDLEIRGYSRDSPYWN